MDVASRIRDLSETIPDFPKPGIVFRDLTPAFGDPVTFRALIADIASRFDGRFDAVAGVEARGFLLAAALSYATDTHLVPIRKGGKLPGEVLSEDYALEYGHATLEMKPDRLEPGSRVLIVDDVLATGGSCAAAARLIERAGFAVAGIALVLELEGLGGREALAAYDVHTLLVDPA